MKKSFVSKLDLAQAYFPHIDAVSARHKLIGLINDDTELINHLKSSGYNPRAHCFSPFQLDLIIARLGNPFNWTRVIKGHCQLNQDAFTATVNLSSINNYFCPLNTCLVLSRISRITQIGLRLYYRLHKECLLHLLISRMACAWIDYPGGFRDISASSTMPSWNGLIDRQHWCYSWNWLRRALRGSC